MQKQTQVLGGGIRPRGRQERDPRLYISIYIQVQQARHLLDVQARLVRNPGFVLP